MVIKSVAMEIVPFSLNDFNKQLQGDKFITHLGDFINRARDHDGYDVVKEFMEKASKNDCIAFINLINEERTPGELAIIFEAWHEIFIRIATDLKDFSAWILPSIRQLLQAKILKQVERCLNTTTHRIVSSALQFITSMTMTGSQAAHEVFTNFDFIKNRQKFIKLLCKTSLQLEKDVRAHALDLLIAFLMCGNSSLKRQILGSSELYCDAFQKISTDKLSTIEIFLRSITTQIIDDTTISKTLKVKLFSSFVLSQVCKLFKWTGPQLMQKKHPKQSEKLTIAEIDAGAERTKISSNEEIERVHQLAKEFLIAVCCSSKKGIVFIDKNLGTANVVNFNIFSFLSHSEKPYLNEMQTATFVEILKACPDLIATYFLRFRGNLTPRTSDVWYTLMSFITKVFNSLDLIKIIGFIDYDTPLLKLVQMFLNVTCSAGLHSSVLQSILENRELQIRHYGVCYVSAVMEKLKKLCNETQEESKLLKSKIPKYRDFKNKLIARVFKLMPLPEDLLRCWDLACCVDVSETDVLNIDLYEHLKVLMDCLSLYLAYIPEDRLQEQFSFGNIAGLLLNLGNLQDGLPSEKFVDLQLRILKRLGENNDSNLLLEKIKHKTVVEILFDILISAKEETTKATCVDLLKQLLISSGAFTSNENELEIWMQHLLLLNENTEGVCRFIENVCQTIAENPKNYLTETNNFILEKEGSNSNDEMEVYIKIFNEMLDDDYQDDQEDYKIMGDSSFSPLIKISCELLDKDYSANENQVEVIGEFLSAVSLDLLNSRLNPNPLWELLHQYSHLLSKKFSRYLNSLKKKREIKESSPKKTKNLRSLLNVVRNCFTSGSHFLSQLNDEELQEIVNDLNQSDLVIVSQQILTYFFFQRELQSHDSNLIEEFCRVLKLILNREVADEVENVCEMILNRPVIQQQFLQTDKWSMSDLAITALLKLEYKRSGSIKKIYQSKAEEYIFKNLNTADNLCETMEPFLNELNSDTISRLATLVCELPIKTLVTNKGKKLSDAGNLLIKLLKCVSNLILHAKNPVLSSYVLCKCFEVYLAMESSDDEKELSGFLLKILENNPIYCLGLNEVMFERLIQRLNKIQNDEDDEAMAMEEDNCVKLIQVLSLYSMDHLLNLEQYLLTLEEYRQPITTLALSYLETVNCSIWKSENGEVLLEKLYLYFWPLVLSSISEETDSTLKLKDSVLAPLLRWFSSFNCISDDDLLAFCNNFSISTLMESVKCEDVLKNCKWMYERLSVTGLKINNFNPIAVYIFNWINMALHLFHDSKSDNDVVRKIQINTLVEFLMEMIENIQTLTDLGRVIHGEKMWDKFIKTILKFGLKDKDGSCGLQLLISILKKLVENKELRSIHCTSIYKLIIAHSNFISGILHSSLDYADWKNCVVDCLILLAKTEKSCCEKSHIPIFLSAYSATLSILNQKILYLIYLYEENEVDVHSFKPFLWGPIAVGHYSIHKSLTHSLWKQPTMEEILNLLDKEIVMETAFKFPIQMQLHPEVLAKVDTKMYDPRFLLSLLNSLLAPESLVHCFKLIESNCLAFFLAALSSESLLMRSAAYHNIALFYQHLEGSRFNKKSQWLCMLDCLKSSIIKENARLPSLITIFLVRCCQLLQNPSDLMSKPILNYLYLKPQLDIGSVPEFIALFHSGDIQHHEMHRNWILTLLNLGFKSSLDYNLCRKQHVFKLLMTYFDCPYASLNGRLLIMEFINQASTLPNIMSKIVNRHGFLPFISTAVVHKNDSIFSSCVKVVYNIWESVKNEGNLFYISEIFSVLTTILNNMSGHQTLEIFEKFLKTLNSCLSARKKGLDSMYLIKLMNVYKIVVEERKNLEKNKYSKSKGTVKVEDVILLDSCKNLMCEVALQWQCDGNTEIFDCLSDFFFCSLSPEVDEEEQCVNYDQLTAFYSWLTFNYESFPALSINSSLVSHIIQCYKCILFGGDGLVATNILHALFTTFRAVVQKIQRQGVLENAFFKHLATEHVQSILGDIFNREFEYSDGELVSLGILVCEMWLMSDKTEKFQFYLEHSKTPVEKRKKRKRKSSGSENIETETKNKRKKIKISSD